MKPVRVGPVAIAGLIVTVLVGIVMQLLRNEGDALPEHSWWEVLLVAALAGGILAAGWRVRRYVEELRKSERQREERERQATVVAAREARPPSDLARRVLVFAQSAAMGGGLLAGWYLGQFGVNSQRWEMPSGRAASIVLAVLTLMGVALSAAGFLVQKWCTLPEDQR